MGVGVARNVIAGVVVGVVAAVVAAAGGGGTGGSAGCCGGGRGRVAEGERGRRRELGGSFG